MSKSFRMNAPGPFRADALKSGDPYELSNGHAIRVMPTGQRGAKANMLGGMVIGSDPAVKSAGVDAGFSPAPGMLRAPDVAVLPDEEDHPGWVKGVPPLAIEYADRGQDEEELAQKIADLLGAGTRHVWVVRLDGVRRVEVHEPGREPYVCGAGRMLEAPGILALPIPAESLYDPQAAQPIVLRNLLARYGYASLDEVRSEGRVEGETSGLRSALLAVLEQRGLAPDDTQRKRIAGADAGTLAAWVARVVDTPSVEALLAG